MAEREGRKLQLRTFAVLPLTEESGLIEWVPNTETFRSLVNKCAADENNVPRMSYIKDRYEKAGTNIEARKRVFRDLLDRYPAVFHLWALKQFPEPTEWFENRLIYARSAAVWSMVGYVLGLGDRHGENILLDLTNGECVHVDFDCLFDKAKRLREPEKVPFRLTQNIIDGFGITGYEGVFKKSCEIALTVLRANYETLTSVLQTFVNDPLVEWDHKVSGDPQNRDVDAILKMVKTRLRGRLTNSSLPLSARGHVEGLIAQATSEANLAAMYIGWMCWM